MACPAITGHTLRVRRPVDDPGMAGRIPVTDPGVCPCAQGAVASGGAALRAPDEHEAAVAKTSELPEMVGEFIELSKQYLREQTLEPAKKLGRLAGFSFAGAIVMALAVTFLAIAGARLIIDVLPDGAIWSGFGYILSSIALLMVTGFVMWRGSR